MKLSNYFFESIKTDDAQTGKAYSAYRRLIKKMEAALEKYEEARTLRKSKSYDDMTEEEIKKADTELIHDAPSEEKIHKGSNRGSFIVPDKNLPVMFLPENPKYVAAIGYRNSNDPIMLLGMLMPGQRIGDQYRHALEDLKSNKWRDTFIHEYIHYLDFLRSKGKYSPDTADMLVQSYEKYVSNPGEYNAYFQQAGFAILAALEKMSKEERADLLSSYEKFKKKFINISAKEPLSNMDEKYSKKLDKRIYRLYKSLEGAA